MQAIVLAAGKGTRLYPLTKKIPKAMIDILDKPLLHHTIESLKKYKIKEIFINLFTLPEKVIDYFASGEKFGVRLVYSREDTKKSYRGPLLLGSAGALHNFKKKLRRDFFVVYGDVFMRPNLQKMLEFHRKKKSLFTLATHNASHPTDSDLVETDKNARITRWIRAPHGKTSGVNSAGLYIIHSKVLQYLPSQVPYDLAHDFIPLLFEKIPLYAYQTRDFMMDVGTRERYNKLLTILSNE